MSNADKRTVATDALATLGTIIDEQQKRDAIHLAVMPVIAGERLLPGESIRVVEGIAWSTEAGSGLDLGIVDPFLAWPVKKGERFWFVMRPRLIQSLRHVWSHPAFPDEPGVAPPAAGGIREAITEAAEIEEGLKQARIADATAVICGIVDDLGDGLTYDQIMEAADDWLASHDGEWGGAYLTQQDGQSWQRDFLTHKERFWEAYAVVRGGEVPEGKRGQFFSCSC